MTRCGRLLAWLTVAGLAHDALGSAWAHRWTIAAAAVAGGLLFAAAGAVLISLDARRERGLGL